MHLELRYFAALREAFGVAGESCEVPAGVATTQQLRVWLSGRGASWAHALAADRPVRVAVDQRLVQGDMVLHEGAEVAFFPPVTGG